MMKLISENWIIQHEENPNVSVKLVVDHANQSITITPNKNGAYFTFRSSKPDTARKIGQLISFAAAEGQNLLETGRTTNGQEANAEDPENED